MTQSEFESLKRGDRVRVNKSGKIYEAQVDCRVITEEESARQREEANRPEAYGCWSSPGVYVYFRQWREDRQALYGPAFVQLKPANITKI